MNINEKFYCSRCMRELEDEMVCPHCGYDPTGRGDACELEEGTPLGNGRYLMGAMIGRGGFGITYAAWDLTLDIPVAVKEYFPAKDCDRDGQESYTVTVWEDRRQYYQLGLRTFLREAQILAMFQNLPAVVQVYDCFEENGTAYIVMEFVRGETLLAYSQRKKLRSKDLLKLLRPVFDDLIRIHKAGVLHRDISPTNILVQEDGTAKLIDFGAAMDLSVDLSGNPSLNRSFAAPEQFDTQGRQGPWTDIYGLAGTIYEILSEKHLPDAASRLADDKLVLQSKREKMITGGIRRSLLRALRIDPLKRTQDMEFFRAELYHLPKPLRSLRDKVLFGAKVAAVILALELATGGVKYCLDEKIPRQIQLSASAFLEQDAETGLRLAESYYFGILGEEQFHEDLTKAAYWYQWAIEYGSVDAMVTYAEHLCSGDRFAQDITAGIAYLQRAAQTGSLEALNDLAVVHFQGNYPDLSDEEAFAYLEQAAESGILDAINNLGYVYEIGLGCEPDAKKAAAYYYIAATQNGDPDGMLSLSLCYADGIGVETDPTEALRYAGLSAYLGNSEAMFQMGEYCRTGNLGFTDYEEAMFWYRQAVDAHHPGGYYGQALLYRDGLGVEGDPEQASRLMMIALIQGYEDAKEECDRMNADGYGIFGD